MVKYDLLFVFSDSLEDKDKDFFLIL
jgi:hypothetical protein